MCVPLTLFTLFFSGVEAARHLPLLLRDGRGVLPLRRADLRHEVRQLDLRRIPGKPSIDSRKIFH